MPTISGESDSNKYGNQEASFINRTPISYRRSIVKLFRDFTLKTNKNEMGRPERIIEFFAEIRKEDVNQVYLDYYDRVQNVRKGGNAILNQEDLFHLIEKFVWEHCEEKVVGINTAFQIGDFAKQCNFFYQNKIDFHPSGKKIEKLEEHRYRLKCLSEKFYYKIEFDPWVWSPDFKELQKLCEDSASREKRNLYFGVKKLNSDIYDLVFAIHNDVEEEIYYGIFLKKNRRILIRNLNTAEPVFVQIMQTPQNYFRVNSFPHLQLLCNKLGRSNFEATFETSLQEQHLIELTDENEKNLVDKRFLQIIKSIDMGT